MENCRVSGFAGFASTPYPKMSYVHAYEHMSN